MADPNIDYDPATEKVVVVKIEARVAFVVGKHVPPNQVATSMQSWAANELANQDFDVGGSDDSHRAPSLVEVTARRSHRRFV